MRQRERERERAEEAVYGRLHLQEPVKRTPGQLTGDDGEEMFIIHVDTIFHFNIRLAVSILAGKS